MARCMDNAHIAGWLHRFKEVSMYHVYTGMCVLPLTWQHLGALAGLLWSTHLRLVVRVGGQEVLWVVVGVYDDLSQGVVHCRIGAAL